MRGHRKRQLRTIISGLRPSHCGVPYNEVNNLVCSLLESLEVFLTVCVQCVSLEVSME